LKRAAAAQDYLIRVEVTEKIKPVKESEAALDEG